MNTIQELKDRRDQLTLEVESIQGDLAPFEEALESTEVIQQGRQRAVQDGINDHKRRIDSRDLEIHTLNQKIDRLEALANRESLAAGYLSGMAIWKADEMELNEKRSSIETRLQQVRQSDQEYMAKARQAETDAATAYAQAVAWGDVEGEKAANAEAQKAAKNLTAAVEHHRRQQLLITALEQELVTIDQHITEAQEEHAKLENKAAHLANTVLEEKWNEAARELLETGGKLLAVRNLINRDPVALMKLDIPEQGEHFGSWTYRELVDLSQQHRLIDLLEI
ncbi:MAG: chromosome segregation protein SMC [Pseudomonas sp.]|uniref:chromosome segregation protein SMC n=1 Tax=Pseudomonas paracarnis TaxID=2750625 RepID=UPI00264C52B6|nr:chromosome segregation protein SMC [Pseudomonas sp.]MDN5420599.1 chromosome segregation protein SMC [Pseudomonadales bacterium]MDN5431573.1 chromosome segregation protein SMC [Pseudomonadales bacterium]